MLARHEVAVPEEQLERLDGLNAAWAHYLEVLDEAQGKLERHKDNFREKVCAHADEGARGVVCAWLSLGIPGPAFLPHVPASLLPWRSACCHASQPYRLVLAPSR